MSQYDNYGKLTRQEVRMLGYCFDEMMKFITEEHEELERVADTFTCGDISEMLKEILQAGLIHYSQLCDMDDEETVKQEMMCAKRTVEYLRGSDQEAKQ